MKNISVSLVFILSFICLSLSASPTTPRIKGKILEAGTSTAIEFADVILYKNGNPEPVAHTYTESDGSFSFSGIQDGEYGLLVRIVGYDLYNRQIKLSSAASLLDLRTIELKPLEVGLAEVVIEAEKRQVIYKLDKKVINASSNIMASGGSAVDILANTPSIRVDAEGDVSFRGSSGFVVYVDGKPSAFKGTQALEQIPAGQIDNIEIITTPSARHDTEGDVGIINIITKQNMGQGLSGMVNISGSTVLSNSVDFLINQQNKNSRWFIGGQWNMPIRKSSFDQQKTTIVRDTTTVSHSDGPRKGKNYFYSFKGGWAYTAPKTEISIEGEIGYAKFTRTGNLYYTEERSDKNGIFEKGEYNSQDDYDLHETYYQGTVAFRHKFNEKGQSLSGSFYLKYGGDALEYFQSDLFDMNGQRQQGHRAWEDEHRWTVRGNLDYILPYSKTGVLETGYQYFSYLEDGDYSMQFWNPTKKEFYWRDDIYNTFYFQRGINSVYLLALDSYKSFDIQVGLRGEHTHQVLRSSKTWANRTQNRFEVFPSVHLGYNFPNDHKVTASYSRRTTRPELFFMEPYITYRDYYSAEIGNPDIRPEYINSYELNYKKNIDEHTLSASLFYRNRKDKIERLRVPYEAGVTLDSMANVGHDRSVGIELSGQLRPVKWWNTTINGNIYSYKVENEYKTEGYNEKSTNYDVAWNNTLDIGKNTKIQLDANFIGPTVTTQGRASSFWYANFAIRQQLFGRKLSSVLSFRDIFNSARYTSDISTPDLQSVTHIRPKYPVITLTLSYTFNNFKRNTSEGKASHDLFEGTNH